MYCMLCFQNRNCEERYPGVLVCSGCTRDVSKILNFLRMHRVDWSATEVGTGTYIADKDPEVNGRAKVGKTPAKTSP